MNITLSPRLNAAAALVRGGGILADIGTDHAYLPVYLIQTGKISGAIAADIGKMPLQNAAETVEHFSLQQKISLRLSDGLNSFAPGEADEFVFAGMGGTLITEKLAEIPWVKNPALHFVFQPQSRAEELREFLYQNGFEINRELAVHEGRRYYIAFDASYTGNNTLFKPSDLFIGRLPHNGDAKEHLVHQLNRLQKKYNALSDGDEKKYYSQIIDDLRCFIDG